MSALDRLRDIVRRNRSGERAGIPSWCTAHADVLRAILEAHRGTNDVVLIEATCNQVNHRGGYTGMTPAAFRDFVFGLAQTCGIRSEQILLGGDHLGPNPWRFRPAAEAMADARLMVRAYVEAGFRKIHLDASMRCADDGSLSEAEMAARAADLCAVAEASSGASKPVYVVGTEVPIPGGEVAGTGGLVVTSPDAVLATFEQHRQAFGPSAGDRVIGIVAQPGVDFSNSQIWRFDANAAAALSAANSRLVGAVFEAHSTDYQSSLALGQLVESHFGILKVGPELTFAFREAVIAMAAIEERLAAASPSRIVEIILKEMADDPRHWRGYISDGPDQQIALLFGLSDRVRYYWLNQRIAKALGQLYANIDAVSVSPGLVSQFTGIPPSDLSAGSSLSSQIIAAKVGAVVGKYREACRA